MRNLWSYIDDHQVVVWLDNWYKRRFGTDPTGAVHCLNVSAMALLRIPDIPIFEGYWSLTEVIRNVGNVARLLGAAVTRLHEGSTFISSEDLQPQSIRVPLDVHRRGMRSLQWWPYMITEQSVGCQGDLLMILNDLQRVHNHTRRVVPLLVDMDIHYRILKLVYGSATADFDFARAMMYTPVLFGVCHGDFNIYHLSSIQLFYF